MREIFRYVLNARESMYTTNKYLYLVSTYKLYVRSRKCMQEETENMLFDIRKTHSAAAHVFVIALFIRIIQKRGSEYKLEKYMHK